MIGGNKKPLGIYVHIPFCVKKCDYCDFISFPAGDEGKDGSVCQKYTDSIIKEIIGYRAKFGCKDTEFNVKTVYIGGGTPSVLAPVCIVRILECIRGTFEVDDDAEITIEVNPGTVNYDKLNEYRRSGINRLSIGLQSANDNELKELGRIHDLDTFLRTYDSALAAGFDNINVDVMTAIPGQTTESLTATLDIVTGLEPGPRHISAYSLILEEGTPFYEKYGGETWDEERERAMYHYTVDYLKKKGFERYEISNFSIPGYESRHNTSYWKRVDYIGFGLAASSLVNNTRYKNTVKLEDYIKTPLSVELFEENIKLDREDRMSEFMFLGLRMSEGVCESDFEREFGISLFDVYGDAIVKMTKEGLLVFDSVKRRCFLSENGIDYGNYVFSEFI